MGVHTSSEKQLNPGQNTVQSVVNVVVENVAELN